LVAVPIGGRWRIARSAPATRGHVSVITLRLPGAQHAVEQRKENAK